MQTAASIFFRFRNWLLSVSKKIPLRKRQLFRKAKNFFAGFDEDTQPAKLGLAFEAFLGGAIYADAEKCFEKIEKCREILLKDKSILLREDFGAGISKKIKKSNAISVFALCKGSSMPADLSQLLFYIIRFCKPENALEMGTCLGISGAYQAAAMQLNGEGKFYTIEGDVATASLASQNFKLLDLQNVLPYTGRFADVLPTVLEEMKQADYILIDGHHNGAATLQYYTYIMQFLQEEAILVFDDIDWSADMRLAWKMLRQKPELYLTIDLGRCGIALFSTQKFLKKHLQFAI